jgi:hypothetical protein
MDADRAPSLMQRRWVVEGKQPSLAGKTKDLYDAALLVQKILDQLLRTQPPRSL